MSPRHRVSRAAIELIKRFEGCRRTAAQLPDGRWTIGHGHTLTARQGAEVSADDAEALLLYDLIAVSHALNEAVFAPLNQNQFDALAAFVFNVGLDNFQQSGVLKRLNEGDLIRAACAMELWRKAMVGGERIVVDALVRRRAAEKALFLTPPDGAWVAAPTPLLRPLLDADAHDIVPAQAPVEVTSALEGEQLIVLREGEPTPVPVPPDPAEEAEGPAKTAAEAVTARLSTLFQDSAETMTSPEASPRPEPFEGPAPFFLRAPDTEADAADETEAAASEPPWASRIEFEDEAPKSDLFSRPEDPEGHHNDAVIEADAAEADTPHEQGRRRGDEGGPFSFDAPMVQPLPVRPEGGVLTLVALAALGLIFFGGGIFWATYARPIAGSQLLGPRIVGGLAGVAGVGFFVVAVYLLLDRLGRAAEHDEL
ncbi:lysozyme [Phenylobacterium sp.]|jgi:lysozyme|uniref:lysozyme n=1 Tax=Phenylobacterium sp. TaxID=1871053 RepID=UPI002F40C0F5